MKYRKTALVEAIQWTGENEIEIMAFVGQQLRVSKPPSQMEYTTDVPNDAYTITIPTMEGELIAQKMDFIIKGIKGECWPCKPDIFGQTYEPAE